ncbi:STAS domain-containing protein [Pseudonocardia hispaniensis]|uniref:STAS domain-containing protein n=1 Tax=Pseudonocardia hispaniensis TaxID=904933 RepID=A0ABW1J7G7_9PSEU
MGMLDHERHPTGSTGKLTISSVQPDRDHALLTVVGMLDHEAVAELCRRTAGLLVAGARYLVVDLSQAHGAHAELLGMLAGVSRRLVARRGWLKLVGAGPAVMEELDEASLSDLFTLYRAVTGGDAAGAASVMRHCVA